MTRDAQHDAEVLAGLDFKPRCSDKSCSEPAMWVLDRECCRARELYCAAHRTSYEIRLDRLYAAQKSMRCHYCDEFRPIHSSWGVLPVWDAPGDKGAS